MATSAIRIDALAGWPKKVVERHHGAIIDSVRRTISIEGIQMVQEAIDATMPHPPVNTGDYRRRWKKYDLPDGARLGNGSQVAGVIARGRRPGFGVSREGQQAIARWVHLHGMDKAVMGKRERRFRRKLMAEAGGDEGKRAAAKATMQRRRRWARDNQAMSIAFLISRAIKRRGLPAKDPLAKIRQKLTDVVLRNIARDIGQVPPV